jgi:hypothetical protein
MSDHLDRALEAIDAGLLEHPGQYSTEGAPADAQALCELRWAAEDAGYTDERCGDIVALVKTLRQTHWAVTEFAAAMVPDDSIVFLNAKYHKLGLLELEEFIADLEDRVRHDASDGWWDGVLKRLRAMLFCCTPSQATT